MSSTELVTLADAARACGVDYRRVWEAVCRHEIASSGYRHPRVRVCDVARWATARERAAAAAEGEEG